MKCLINMLLSVLLMFNTSAYADIYLNFNQSHRTLAIQSWKDRRDDNIVKQDLDYSCGAASLATILNAFYHQSVTEADILKAINQKERASFEDMKQALTHFGFRAVGYAASYDQLTQLKIPVIVYVKHRKSDHFSVLRGINEQTVWLADPSLGNRTYSRQQFMRMWNTRDDEVLQGKILAILPNEEHPSDTEFFTSQPKRQTAEAVRNHIFRIGQ